MKTNNVLGTLITILIGIFVFFVGINVESEGNPLLVYRVYLNGNTIGLIESEEELLNLINDKQNGIKEKYGIDKVHPPKGLEIKETYTFNNDIISTEEIYNIIQDKDPFTISGYTAEIKYPEEDEANVNKESIYINVLKKEDFENAFKSVVKAFVGSKDYELYANNSQPEITDIGSNIETIYWEENVTIKENLINVDSHIFTDLNDVSKFLLYGSLDKHEDYVVREGDDIKTIAENNKLSTEEFLIANPEFTSENALLTPGKVVNIGLIEPMVTITTELHVVEDIINNYKVEYISDNTAYLGTEKVVQEGVDGITRVTEKVLYKNGEIHNLIIVRGSAVEIKPVINKIVSRGTKTYSGGTYINTGNANWYWPTVSPYIITSYYGYRWGAHHNGIDISGSGFGSPIYSSTDGVVIRAFNDCPSSGRGLGDRCGGGYGNYVEIQTSDNQYKVIYAHMVKGIKVNLGDTVSRGQILGYMGNSGRSSGTHLHFEINTVGGLGINPCRVIGC